MKKEIENLIRFYEDELHNCMDVLAYFDNGNERIEGLIHAYRSIIDKLRIIVKD